MEPTHPKTVDLRAPGGSPPAGARAGPPPEPAPDPQYPEEGDTLGGYEVVRQIGRGAAGRVYLARQTDLSARLVVLKVGPPAGREHLSLAQLPHTNIVPIHAAEEFPQRRLRLLCMPYFGGTSLGLILDGLSSGPGRWRAEPGSGRRLLEALDRRSAVAPPLSDVQPARDLIARATFVQAACWVGACLAEALDYAHQRGLVHLDLKPGNVLIAADGQPMLLDFHLAQPPLKPGAPPGRVGGTDSYMSPEQRRMIAAVRAGGPVPERIDGRSDQYSLALVLYELLGG